MESLVLLSALDRQHHLRTVVEPALAAGKWVLCDRYYYSAEAFFFARGVAREVVRELNPGVPKPDLTVYLDIPSHVSHERILRRDGKWSSVEEQDADFLERVRAGFEGAADSSFLKLDGLDSSVCPARKVPPPRNASETESTRPATWERSPTLPWARTSPVRETPRECCPLTGCATTTSGSCNWARAMDVCCPPISGARAKYTATANTASTRAICAIPAKRRRPPVVLLLPFIAQSPALGCRSILYARPTAFKYQHRPQWLWALAARHALLVERPIQDTGGPEGDFRDQIAQFIKMAHAAHVRDHGFLILGGGFGIKSVAAGHL